MTTGSSVLHAVIIAGATIALEVLMLLPKSNPMRSKVLRESPRLQPCVMCGSEGTTVLAHLPVAGEFGIGMKISDLCGAHLCAKCHSYADLDGRQDWKWRFTALARTLQRLCDRGILEISP